MAAVGATDGCDPNLGRLDFPSCLGAAALRAPFAVAALLRRVCGSLPGRGHDQVVGEGLRRELQDRLFKLPALLGEDTGAARFLMHVALTGPPLQRLADRLPRDTDAARDGLLVDDDLARWRFLIPA